MMKTTPAISFLPLSLVAMFVGGLSAAAHGPVPVILDLRERHQVIEGFGTSINAWHADVAACYSQPAFAPLYLETIGASALRIELWADSAPVAHERWQEIDYHEFALEGPGRRGGLVLDVAQRLLTASQGKLRIIASVWTPPAWMKVNGSTRNDHPARENFALNFDEPGERGLWTAPLDGADGEARFQFLGRNKLRPDRYLHFAKLLVEWTRYLRTRGIELYALSPQNEPRFSHWFESCVYTPDEYAELLRVVAWMFDHEKVPRPQLFGPEHMTYDVAGNTAYLDAVAARPAACAALSAVASHGYIDGYMADKHPGSPQIFRQVAAKYGKKIWITEGSSGGHVWPAPLHEFAVGLINALTEGDVSLYTPWQIISRTADEHGLMAMSGPTKKTAVAMQFWRFIRPGMVRVGLRGEASGLGLVAFADRSAQRWVLVVANRKDQEAPIALQSPAGQALQIDALYLTDAGHDCARREVGVTAATLSIPASSVVTIVGH